MSWKEVRFEELYSEPSRNGIYKSKEHRGRGIKMVNMGELFANDFIGEQEMELIALSASEMSRNCLAEGDLLFGRRSLTEEGAGKTSIVNRLTSPTTFESSLIRARLDKSKVNPLFYFYYLKSPNGRGKIKSIVSGVNVKGIRGSDLKNVPMPFPEKGIQDRISDILSAYDDLIEINNRRIQLLEDAARQVYQEWFVRLRFPGHEQTPMHDGLPEGWERVKASEIIDVLSGGTPKTNIAEYWDGDIPFFTPKDCGDTPFVLSTEKSLTESGLKNCNSRLFDEDALFITARGTVGNLQLALVPMAMNQSCYALSEKVGIGQFYLYCAMSAEMSHLKNQAVGAVFSAIIVKTFDQITLTRPDGRNVDKFNSVVNPIFGQIKTLILQNQKLCQARDLLLPRLMRGELIT